MSLERYKKYVEEALPSFLPKPEGYAKELYEAMRYSVCAPGKRLRAALCLIGAEIAGLPKEKALPFACAIEMIHAYSLIHDDLPCMDDDDLRRGRPSCHIAFGEAVALLAGDALLSHAFETMLSAALDSKGDKNPYIKAMNCIAKGIGAYGMIAGQTADMDGIGADEESLSFIQKNKTSKLITASLSSGLLLADAPEGMLRDFEIYASHLGDAFQITDDILDVIGDENILGKPVGSDSQQDKATAVALWGLEECRRRAAEHIRAAVAAVSGYPGAEELARLAESLANRTH